MLDMGRLLLIRWGASLAEGVQRLRSKTAQNLLFLYGVTAANYIFPLLTLPFLARTLGPEGFGVLAIVQSLAQYLSLLVEYGFTLSATREVARYRDNKKHLAEILGGVLGARFLLSLGVVVLAMLLSQVVLVLRDHAILLWAGVFWAIMLGMSPIWYFQGQERLRSVSLLELLTKSLAVIGIFAFVREPEDAYKVLLAQALATTLATVIGWRWAWLEVGFMWPKLSSVTYSFYAGWRIFFAGAFISLYTSANSFILGLFVSPQQVGFFAGADRLTRAALSLLQPLIRVYLPKLSHLVEYDPNAARALFRRNTLFSLFFGLGGVFALWFTAPAVVGLFLGDSYEPSVKIMYILGLIILPVSLASVWGTQWMLANKLDRELTNIYIGAGLLNVVLAFALIPKMGSIGLAFGVVAAEVFGVSMMWLVLKRQNLWFMRKGNK